MSLLLVAYPDLNADDYTWIQDIRRTHDSNYSLISPHFTVVFPTHTTDPARFIEHVTTCTQQCASFSFAIRCAMIVKDSYNPMTHLFLVPDEGYSTLVKLHDELYRGVLEPGLNLDVAYIPHLTIGDHLHAHALKPVADAINHQNRCIFGRVRKLDILAYEHDRVKTLHTISLR